MSKIIEQFFCPANKSEDAKSIDYRLIVPGLARLPPVYTIAYSIAGRIIIMHTLAVYTIAGRIMHALAVYTKYALAGFTLWWARSCMFRTCSNARLARSDVHLALMCTWQECHYVLT